MEIKLLDVAQKLWNTLEEKYNGKIDISILVRGIKYLAKFGYLDALERLDEITIGDVIRAVIDFQNFHGLEPDGELGPKTANVMNYPRCNQKDVEMNKTSGYWGTHNLKYYIGSRDKDMPKEMWDANIERALQQWSDVCNLKFTRVNSSKSANLLFDVGYKRSEGFDGSSGTLAWYQLPPRNGFTGQLKGKFDQSEAWLHWTEKQRGIYLLNVACHEIGHGLGLYHATGNRGNLMDPIYSARVAKPQSGDISRIQQLYGAPEDDKPTKPADPKPEPKDEDDDGNFDGKEAVIRITGDITNIKVDGFRISKIG